MDHRTGLAVTPIEPDDTKAIVMDAGDPFRGTATSIMDNN